MNLLQEAGIRTFAHLAVTDVSELQAILDPARLRFIDPSTWAEQAKLAAEGKFDELKTLPIASRAVAESIHRENHNRAG